jgi:uncharacterized protein (TIGR00369 family)
VPLTDEEQQARRRSISELFPTTPFISMLGLVVERYEPDEATMRLPFRADLTNDGKVFHGGVVASALDTTGALAAWSNHDFDRGVRASTVSMTVQYIGAAKQSDLIVHASARKRGRELIFTEIEAFDDAGTLVAQALQTYRIV